MTVFLVDDDDMMPTHKMILSKKNHFFPGFVAENREKIAINRHGNKRNLHTGRNARKGRGAYTER